MIAAHIENGVVVNMVVVDGFTSDLIDPKDSSVGDIWDGEKFIAPVISDEDYNAPILAQLASIDAQSIGPLRDGDADRLAELRQQASLLRAQLRK